MLGMTQLINLKMIPSDFCSFCPLKNRTTSGVLERDRLAPMKALSRGAAAIT